MKKVTKVVLSVIGTLISLVLIFVFIVFLSFKSLMKPSRGEPIPNYDALKSALLVIDIQEGTSGSLAGQYGYGDRSKSFVQNVNSVIQQADSIHIPIVYIYHYNKNTIVNFLSGSMLAQNAPGTAFDQRLLIKSKNIFDKYKSDGFTNLELDLFLRKNEINHLILTGLDIAHCVDKTSLGALNREYKISIIKDAVIGSDEDIETKMLKIFQDRGYQLSSTKNWLEVIK